ncbi:GNAT family N-acetyltransferase [Actinospica durhamensis]|uniref:GNAT family N-acetyltransferase n=1 Tax=Actinospica durhamensis TaxID=1508375 RepID=A0A941F0P2_9ACTN|nr:GNAT family N-acetyltransferase [Actinospica durhamensis]MBR7839439.1 GNAT family N-acetyltransferase [Actinospica durhamensis]
MGFQVTPATEQDWAEVVEWAAEEQWNPGLADRAHFLAQDPGGFFLGRLDGRPVSAVSVVAYDHAYAFLGFYLVRPDLRGRGLGVATWRAGLEHAGARTVGLDGVIAQQDNYRKSGFSFAHRTLRYAGVPIPRPPRGGAIGVGGGADVAGADVAGAAAAGMSAPGLIEIDEDLEFVRAVADYDRQCYPADRPAFVARWVTAPYHTAYAAVRDGQVCGYGVIRPARDGYRIGPLFADTAEDAADLFDALTASVEGAPVMLDIPEPNQAGLSLAKSRGLEEVFETARMYTGPIRKLSDQKIFGVTTLELG